ncbi:hypothetical protein [Arthrobacter sp. PsM3]|uniref:hypothetical protein n=1 Tax=Arthrobacter sp. PsM3 TaxID=3030531 RepID=UPI00263A5CF2|nr:hypothetical protein [Arthrobacter sp. PsM3]MDN4645364.1 hypothetical protein [Arthrobacter sp. PsM3]
MTYPGSALFPGGPSTDLATVQDLAAFSQQAIAADDATAIFLLKVASGMIRAFLDQTVTLMPDDVEYLDPVNSSFASLRELPVVSVSTVEISPDGGLTWAVVPASSYKVSRRTGTITARQGSSVRWPADEESWRVTYTHGYQSVPPELAGVCCGLAARYYSTPIAVDMERVGQRQVKYNIEAGGFSAMESMALSGFRLARLA